MAAAFAGHLDAVKVLIDAGAAVDTKDQNGRTALHAAALGGDDAIAKALLAKGADLNAEDQAGSTALTYAAANGHDRFVQMLQTAGLKKGSEMALALAARGCYPETLAILLKSKASSNARMQGKPALSLAAAAGCEAQCVRCSPPAPTSTPKTMKAPRR